ncbi:hypothetical protein Rcae01_06488 [Novipirellula caenicola]|uniref:Uncharacterized protein n=1 Tax=Novipirellula caenicola TaxID=1536901 RepID=A0ABP9W0R7_9BACT
MSLLSMTCKSPTPAVASMEKTSISSGLPAPMLPLVAVITKRPLAASMSKPPTGFPAKTVSPLSMMFPVVVVIVTAAAANVGTVLLM